MFRGSAKDRLRVIDRADQRQIMTQSILKGRLLRGASASVTRTELHLTAMMASRRSSASLSRYRGLPMHTPQSALSILTPSYSTSATSFASGGGHPHPKADRFAATPHDPSSVNTKYWKRLPDGRYQRPIFVAATKQHVGKTSTSLSIVSGLQKRFDKVGFIKPVGQQHVEVKSDSGETIRVDKDVCLVRERFSLHHLDYNYMSPVIIPRGYTKKFIDGEVSYEQQIADIETAFEHVSATSDVVVAEGTGHCGVGSIVNVNNAKVAAALGADMVLIANGGLGSAFDELELNRVLCQHHNVRIAGVVINKVLPDKLEQTRQYMGKALRQAWGVPLLGCVPDRPYLGCPALADLEKLFRTELVCGQQHRFRHYNVDDLNLVTTSLSRFLENLREKNSRTLYVAHVTRDDLILGFMAEYQRTRRENEPPFEAALIICGRKGKYQLSTEVKDMLNSLEGAPVMVVELSTHQAMQKIHSFTPKLNIDDTNRVGKAVEHYEPYIDFDELLRRTRSQNTSFNVPGDISFEDLRTR